MKDVNQTIWPGNKQCAFSLCFDLDADTIWLNKLRSVSNGLHMLKGPSVGKYGPRRGADRILNILEKYGIKATFFIPAVVLRQYPELVRRILDQGHEIGHHGFYHEMSYGNTVEAQMDVIEKSQEVFLQEIGKKAVGFRCTGSLLPGTQKILFTDPNTVYYSRGAIHEVPKFIVIEGKKTDTVHLPCRQELDDYIQMTYNLYPPIPAGLSRIQPYNDVLSNFEDEVDGSIRFHGVQTTAFHPQVSGSPGKSMILEKLIQYIIQHDEVWLAPCREVAEWWRSQQKKEGEQHVQGDAGMAWRL